MYPLGEALMSFPSRERGLKYFFHNLPHVRPRSFPSRERGLKFGVGLTNAIGIAVVPFAGTWIEIKSEITLFFICESFPSRERGLKYA